MGASLRRGSEKTSLRSFSVQLWESTVQGREKDVGVGVRVPPSQCSLGAGKREINPQSVSRRRPRRFLDLRNKDPSIFVFLYSRTTRTRNQ